MVDQRERLLRQTASPSRQWRVQQSLARSSRNGNNAQKRKPLVSDYLGITNYNARLSPPRDASRAAEIPLTAIAEKEKQRRISRAAQVLEPYFVNASDLNVLCGSESHFAEGEQALTDRIAKAWAELAPYGVSSDDLKKLISENLKYAWRRSRSQQPLNPQHLDGHRKFGMQNNPNPSQREVRALLPTDGFLHSPIRERSE